MKIKLPRIKIPASAPVILTVISGVGVIATAISSAICTPKAEERIYAAAERRIEETPDGEELIPLTKFEKVVAAAPAYLPAAAIALTTIACMVSSTALSRRQQAMLVSAYGVLDQSYKNFKRKTNELYGKDAVKNVQNALAEENRKNELIKHEQHDPEECLFYLEDENRWFWRPMICVKEAEYNLNKLFATGEYADLNDFYSYLDLECTQYGSSVGWTSDSGYYVYGYNWIDFVHEYVEPEDLDAPPYYIIRFLDPPRSDFMAIGLKRYLEDK